MARDTDLLLGGVLRKFDSDPSKQTREFRKKLPKAIRAALEKTFQHWLKVYAPLHFKRQAFAIYDEYKQNYKRGYKGKFHKYEKGSQMSRLAGRIRYGKDTDRPLVKTGALEKAFLKGAYRFTGSNERLTVKWTGLPQYAHPYRPNQTRKAVALTEVNNQEDFSLVDIFEKYLEMEIGKIDPASRTFGRAVI